MFCNASEKQAESGGKILSHFSLQALAETYVAIHMHFRLITTFKLPISIIKNAVFRSESRFKSRVKRSTLVEGDVRSIRACKNCVASQMSATEGALMYDGWNARSTH